MYGLSSGQWPSYLRLVVAVEWGYEEVQQVLGVLMPNRHDEQWSPWSGDGMADVLISWYSQVPLLLASIYMVHVLEPMVTWRVVSGGVELSKKSVMYDCHCPHAIIRLTSLCFWSSNLICTKCSPSFVEWWQSLCRGWHTSLWCASKLDSSQNVHCFWSLCHIIYKIFQV